jgi:hypothetical protein
MTERAPVVATTVVEAVVATKVVELATVEPEAVTTAVGGGWWRR